MLARLSQACSEILVTLFALNRVFGHLPFAVHVEVFFVQPFCSSFVRVYELSQFCVEVRTPQTCSPGGACKECRLGKAHVWDGP